MNLRAVSNDVLSSNLIEAVRAKNLIRVKKILELIRKDDVLQEELKAQGKSTAYSKKRLQLRYEINTATRKKTVPTTFGSVVNGTDHHGNSAIDYAVSLGDEVIVNLLIKAKANVKPEKFDLIKLAKKNGHTSIIKLLSDAMNVLEKEKQNENKKEDPSIAVKKIDLLVGHKPKSNTTPLDSKLEDIQKKLINLAAVTYPKQVYRTPAVLFPPSPTKLEDKSGEEERFNNVCGM